MPGTQSHDRIIPMNDVGVCTNCHGNYDKAFEPPYNWRGSMMAHAGRAPVFLAALAIAGQDFDGSGDLCIRCHAPAGWSAGRSTPTDGSALDPVGDRNGIQCDVCHGLTNPDQSEHLGVQLDPFIAISGDAEGHYGSGQYVTDRQRRDQAGSPRRCQPADGCARGGPVAVPSLAGAVRDLS